MKDEGRARALSRLFGLALCAALAACGATPQAPRAPQRVGPAAPAPTTPAPLPTAVAAAPAPAPDPTALAAGLGAGQTLTLAVGETASLGVEGASVSFDRVVEDSRCPANAQCIWQGRVVVAGHVTAGGERRPFTLGTLAGLDDAPDSLAAGPYTLRIADVEPHPATPDGIPRDAYVLTLEIGQAP